MRLSNFEVTIPQGDEQTSGHVGMKHNSKYSIRMHNGLNRRCDALVTVDGKEIGMWRVDPFGTN